MEYCCHIWIGVTQNSKPFRRFIFPTLKQMKRRKTIAKLSPFVLEMSWRARLSSSTNLDHYMLYTQRWTILMLFVFHKLKGSSIRTEALLFRTDSQVYISPTTTNLTSSGLGKTATYHPNVHFLRPNFYFISFITYLPSVTFRLCIGEQ